MKWFKKLLGQDEVVERTAREAYFEEQEAIDTPWANFEVTGFDENGIRVEFNWNDAFIAKIRSLGFEAETEEDCVQLFFYASQMRPAQLASGDEPVQSEAHPTLSGQQNVIRT